MMYMYTHILLCIVAAVLSTGSEAQHQQTEVCRESNWNFTWNLPSNFVYHFVELQYTGPSYDKQEDTYPITTKYNGSDWKFNTDHPRYIGRMKTVGISSFILESVYKGDHIGDPGKYAFKVSAPNTTGIDDTVYDLVVFSENNLFPTIVGNDSNVEAVTETDDTIFKYTWGKPVDLVTPLIGVRMSVSSAEVSLDDKECYFESDNTTCSIEYKASDFGDYSGMVKPETIPIYRPGAPKCTDITPFQANIAFNVDNSSKILHKGMVGAIIGAVVVIIFVAIVVPMVLKYKKYKTTQGHHISLKDGLEFVTYCCNNIQAIVSHREWDGIYRKSAPLPIIHGFIKEYKKQDSRTEMLESFNKLQVAAAIKYFIREEKTPWIPVDKQREISTNANAYMTDNNTFRSSDIRKMFKGDDITRFDIVTALFRHFHWIVQMKVRHNASEMMDAKGLALVLAPNFFKEMPPDHGEALRQNTFINSVIDHCDEIFTEPNGAGVPEGEENGAGDDHDESSIPMVSIQS